MIGTVNASESLITLAVSIMFIVALASGHLEAEALFDACELDAGLIVGGVVAAQLPDGWSRPYAGGTLLRLVGGLIMLLPLFQTAQQVGLSESSKRIPF